MRVFERFDDYYDFDPLLRLMLEALVEEGPRAEAAFARWLGRVDPEALDPEAIRLLPALVRRYEAALDGHPARRALLGVRRRARFRNGLLMADGRGAIEALQDAGVEVVLFKGIATALKYFDDPADRPLGDIDVLVHRENVERADAILRGRGWKYFWPEARKRLDVHSHDYGNERRSGFDLHWHCLVESPVTGIDDGLHARARPADWEGLPVRVMAPEDLLLTTLVNAVRIVHPVSAYWILDIVRIVAAEPSMRWALLWDEACRRDLREAVFNTLSMVHGLSPATVPDTVFQSFLDADPGFREGWLQTALEESRTWGLDHANPAVTQAIGAHARSRASATGGTAPAQNVRVFPGADGAIERLFLQRHHLVHLADLFDVADPGSLAAQFQATGEAGDGYLPNAGRRIAWKSERRLRDYAARIDLPDQPGILRMAPGDTTDIRVEVGNASTSCWPVAGGEHLLFGLTYHLHAADGRLITWDLPRSYLAIARRHHVAFIAPGQAVACRLTLHAPWEPGDYEIRLDLVQELVAWFSEQGCAFPRLALEVRRAALASRYVPRSRGLAFESDGDETTIFDYDRAACFTAGGHGSFIWQAIAKGYEVAAIVAAFEAAGVLHRGSQRVEAYIANLVAEGLLEEAVRGDAPPRDTLRVGNVPGTAAPTLVRQADLMRLIGTHPLRAFSPQTGWPHPREAGGSAEAAGGGRPDPGKK